MNSFNDWNDVLAMKGLREAVVAYAIAEAPEYLEGRTRGQAAPCKVTRLKVAEGRDFRSA
jgi:hypothetical protein